MSDSYFILKADFSSKDDEDRVIAGVASAPIVDKQNELIPTSALKEAFRQFMADETYRNVMLKHGNFCVGKIVDNYTDKRSQTWKTGFTDDGRLFVVAQIRKGYKKADEVWQLIKDNHLKSFSIGGEALHRSIKAGEKLFTEIDKLEVYEVTLCESGANQEADFHVVKELIETTPERWTQLHSQGDTSGKMTFSETYRILKMEEDMKMSEAKPPEVTPVAAPAKKDEASVRDFGKEIDELKTLITTMSEELKAFKPKKPEEVPVEEMPKEDEKQRFPEKYPYPEGKKKPFKPFGGKAPWQKEEEVPDATKAEAGTAIAPAPKELTVEEKLVQLEKNLTDKMNALIAGKAVETKKSEVTETGELKAKSLMPSDEALFKMEWSEVHDLHKQIRGR